jgi:N-acetylmuramoyl-L-alanine amidase-like protein
MPLYPGANVRLLDPGYSGYNPIAVHNRVNLHVQAGTGSLYGFFNASGRSSSHFWVSYTGVVEQYVDTDRAAEADLDGNDATISIETEGGTGSTADTEQWTQAQVDAIVSLVAWITETHGIPRVWVENAHSGNSGSRGIGVHRHGIDGNFPSLPDIRAGRKQRGGGMHYSNSTGKLCPGGGKIQQVPYIIDRISGGAGVTPPPVGPPTTPPDGVVDVDGYWGSDTTRELQRVFGTPVDGEIWGQYAPNAQTAFTTGWVYNYPNPKGSPLIRAMQALAGLEQDGVVGPDFIRELQRRMGTVVDGELWAQSPCIMELQRRINAGDAPVSG